jgi:integrase
MAKLTSIAVKAARCLPDKRRPVRFGDGNGLYLQVAPGDTKSWLFRYTLRGKAREMGLGPAGDRPDQVSLAKARQLAAEARALLREGRDPIEVRKAGRTADEKAKAEASRRTFRAMALSLLESKQSGWRSAKHRADWLATITTYAYPVIGDMSMADVDTDAVLRVLEPIWERIPETASRLRQRIEAVLDAARAKGWRAGENPARWKGHLAELLAPPRKIQPGKHFPALPWQAVPAFMAALRTRPGVAALALEFAILTASRVGEVRGARWPEIDFATKVWTVPRERMKGDRQHRVPLSSAALAVLERLCPRPLARGSEAFVFPGHTGGRLWDHTWGRIIERLNADREAAGLSRWCDADGRDVVPHAFRSSFRDWVAETQSVPHAVAEAALAHMNRDRTEAAYARSDLLERRRSLMAAWADFCGQPAEVVELRGSAQSLIDVAAGELAAAIARRGSGRR